MREFWCVPFGTKEKTKSEYFTRCGWIFYWTQILMVNHPVKFLQLNNYVNEKWTKSHFLRWHVIGLQITTSHWFQSHSSKVRQKHDMHHSSPFAEWQYHLINWLLSMLTPITLMHNRFVVCQHRSLKIVSRSVLIANDHYLLACECDRPSDMAVISLHNVLLEFKLAHRLHHWFLYLVTQQ